MAILDTGTDAFEGVAPGARHRNGSNAPDGNFVRSLASGLEVIRCFGPERKRLTLSEVARLTGQTRAKSRRLLLTLRSLGYVECEGRHFRLSPKILDLGFSYLSSLDFWDVAEPVMRRVSGELGESCSAGVLDREDVVIVARNQGTRMVSITLGVGAHLPAWASAMGRVLLSDLPETALCQRLKTMERRQLTARTVCDVASLRRLVQQAGEAGYCIVDEEFEDGLISLAVPVLPRRGRMVAALNLCSHVSRMRPESMERDYLPVLRRAAEEIGASIA